jgi:hypothetical protein
MSEALFLPLPELGKKMIGMVCCLGMSGVSSLVTCAAE